MLENTEVLKFEVYLTLVWPVCHLPKGAQKRFKATHEIFFRINDVKKNVDL